MAIRVNVGCGTSPTPGWINIDGSPTVLLARMPVVGAALRRLGGERRRFAELVAQRNIRFAFAGRLPVADRSADAVYTCHMLEHLDSGEVDTFLKEARRVLLPGGVLRVAVPDLKLLVARYAEKGDADDFIASTLLAAGRPRGVTGRLLAATFGHRGHAWLYDERSLRRRLEAAGFVNVAALPAGHTTIRDPGELDLRERADESLYVEGAAP